MEINVRRAEIEDSRSIADILIELGWFAHIDQGVHLLTPARIKSHLRYCISGQDHSVYVAVNKERDVVGYTSVHWIPCMFLPGPEGYITELFMKEYERGKGIGGSLLAVVEQEAKERGCSRLMLLNGRHRESYKRGFYKKHGWQERDRLATFVYMLMETNSTDTGIR
ncbi:MAG: GNAT family N-acetyltransferase [Thermodesulfobacteriota bacterium]|nr:GNAT family N-acetyltransferase [Thermodesulfobacteriota bacterium]